MDDGNSLLPANDDDCPLLTAVDTEVEFDEFAGYFGVLVVVRLRFDAFEVVVIFWVAVDTFPDVIFSLSIVLVVVAFVVFVLVFCSAESVMIVLRLFWRGKKAVFFFLLFFPPPTYYSLSLVF